MSRFRDQDEGLISRATVYGYRFTDTLVLLYRTLPVDCVGDTGWATHLKHSAPIPIAHIVEDAQLIFFACFLRRRKSTSTERIVLKVIHRHRSPSENFRNRAHPQE